MAGKLTANISKEIQAPAEQVWKALTDPELIKQYMFGTNTVSDWKKGSTITYMGEWEGKQYKDSGTIVDIVPGKLLHTTYFSNLSGKEDIPENYANVIYALDDKGTKTILTITQDNIENEEHLQHTEQNWNMILDTMKNMLEKH